MCWHRAWVTVTVAGLCWRPGRGGIRWWVGWLGEALGGHARTASMFGGAELLPLMVPHARFVRAGFGVSRGRERGEIAGVSARYAEFCGWLCQDLGRWGDAVFWSDRALDWARESGDNGLVSYVLMRQSDLAEGHRPEGTGHALNGDVAGFERMMDAARQDAVTAAVADDAPWGLYCTPVHVAMQEASGWLQLGQPGKAVTVFERVIGGLPATDRVDTAAYRARLARAYALDGRLECAAGAALAAREAVAVTGSWRARCELALVRKLIGRQPQSAAAARFAAIFDTAGKAAGSSRS